MQVHTELRAKHLLPGINAPVPIMPNACCPMRRCPDVSHAKLLPNAPRAPMIRYQSCQNAPWPQCPMPHNPAALSHPCVAYSPRSLCPSSIRLSFALSRAAAHCGTCWLTLPQTPTLSLSLSPNPNPNPNSNPDLPARTSAMRSVLVLNFKPHTYSERRMFMCRLCKLGTKMPSGTCSSACSFGAADTSSACRPTCTAYESSRSGVAQHD